MSETNHRLENLEIKLMDLENAIGELNAVVIRQANEINSLQQAHKRLLGQIDALNPTVADTGGEPPPPHY